MKKCSKCKIDKELSDFGKRKHNNDGLHLWCKSCIKQDTINRKKYRKQYNKINNSKIKKYYELNKEKYLEQRNEWIKNNKERIKELSKINNKKKTKEQIKDNNIKQKKYKVEWSKFQYKNNIQFRLTTILRCRLLSALVSKTNKFKSALVLLGCSIEEFKQHLESQFKPEMNWDNHGSYWEIDHIQPCISFNLIDPLEQAKCFHYTNMQPLTINENRTKKDKIK